MTDREHSQRGKLLDGPFRSWSVARAVRSPGFQSQQLYFLVVPLAKTVPLAQPLHNKGGKDSRPACLLGPAERKLHGALLAAPRPWATAG